MIDIWVIMQVAAFGAFLGFSSYLTYRRRMNQIKRVKPKQAILI